MSEKNIRVLALDLDGTLTNDEKKVTPRTRAALDAAVAATAGLVRRSTGGSGAEQPGRAGALRILLRRRGRGGEAPEGAEPQA